MEDVFGDQKPSIVFVWTLPFTCKTKQNILYYSLS
jgi:hypothetical protein